MPPKSGKPSGKRRRAQFRLVENRHQQTGVPLHKRDRLPQKFRGQPKDVKILLGGEARKVFRKNAVLPLHVRVRLVLQLHHQVSAGTVALEDRREGGNVRKRLLESAQRELRNTPGIAVEPQQVGIVEHHRLEVLGPAHVELQPVDARMREGAFKSGAGVFENCGRHRCAAMGDDPALPQRLRVRHGLGPVAEAEVATPLKSVFQPRRQFHRVGIV